MFLLFHETFPLAWNITGVFPRRVGLSVIESIVMPLVITDGTVRWNRNLGVTVTRFLHLLSSREP